MSPQRHTKKISYQKKNGIQKSPVVAFRKRFEDVSQACTVHLQLNETLYSRGEPQKIWFQDIFILTFQCSKYLFIQRPSILVRSKMKKKFNFGIHAISLNCGSMETRYPFIKQRKRNSLNQNQEDPGQSVVDNNELSDITPQEWLFPLL